MGKRVLVFSLAFFMFLAFAAPTYAAPVYKDVPDSYRFKAEFDFLAKQGILAPDAAADFRVEEEITRIEAAAFLAAALKLDVENRPVPVFSDVSPDDPNFPLIAAIVDEKIMLGTLEGEFRPNDKLTRAQMAVILVKAFGLKGTSSTTFKDVPAKFWAAPYILTLIGNKITVGYKDYTFKPNQFISRSHFIVFLARILNPEFRRDVPLPPAAKPPVPKPPSSCEKPAKTATYKVNVVVTNMWKYPNQTRSLDRPSLAYPVDMPKWLGSMTTSQKRWLTDRTDTQAVFGEEVSLLTTGSSWYQIAAKNQYVPYQKEGYPGWIPKSHITKVTKDYSDCAVAVVTAKTAALYNPDTKKRFMDISYSTILPVIKAEGDWLHLQTPANGIKLLHKSMAKTAKNYAAVKKPTQADIVNNAKKFLGLPYLWAGTSAYGFDCSGIIYAVYKNYGMLIPRDSFYQATKGTAVSKQNLQPGDLVFFAYNGGRGKVYHVGIYIGSGKMIHAPNSSSNVRIEALNAGVYKTNYSGARRYIN